MASWIRDDDGQAYSGDIVLIGSKILNNRIQTGAAGRGHVAGGGMSSVGLVDVLRSEVSGNQVVSTFSDADQMSSTEGGGIAGFQVRVIDSVIRGNSLVNTHQMSNTGGAGIAATGAVEIRGTAVIENHSNVFAGGLMHNGSIAGVSELRIDNSTFSGNSADMAAGAVLSYTHTSIANSTLVFNVVDIESPLGIGGVALMPMASETTLTLDSSIIHRNSAPETVPDAADLAVLFTQATAVGSGNLIGDSSGVVLPADTLGADPQLLSLADNGGSSPTHALDEGSPAVDAGHNVAGFDFDQRGGHYLRVHGAAADIGAFESQPLPDIIFRHDFEQVIPNGESRLGGRDRAM